MLNIKLTEIEEKRLVTYTCRVFNEDGYELLSFTADAESEEDFILRYSDQIKTELNTEKPLIVAK